MPRKQKSISTTYLIHVVIFAAVFAIGLFFSYAVVRSYKREVPTKVDFNSPIPSTTPTAVPLRMKTAFIPYWMEVAEDSDFRQYDRLVYFGVAVNKEGIRENEPGSLKMEKTLPVLKAKGLPVWTAVRMTNTDENIDILNATSSWETITKDIGEFATKNDLDGIVLDFEISALPSEGLRMRIGEFVKAVHAELSGKSIPLAITIYGDVFYRKRPYDLKALEASSEEIMIMAYDFHKAGGEPGPNFPYGGKDRYNYDFPTMIRDFRLFIPAEKLTVIYGMYGYDWIVDEKKRPIKPATSLTLHQIRSKFLDSCEWEHCIVRRDEEAGESEVNYIDKAFNYHIVWFEDVVSVEKKIQHIRTEGIDSVAYWAWGYY